MVDLKREKKKEKKNKKEKDLYFLFSMFFKMCLMTNFGNQTAKKKKK